MSTELCSSSLPILSQLWNSGQVSHHFCALGSPSVNWGALRSTSTLKLYDLSQFFSPNLYVAIQKCYIFFGFMTLLASPVAYFHSLLLEYHMVANGKREWSWRQSAFQLSNVVFRDALWWKGRASVHRTMSLTILNNKYGVKKNGRNTGSCWTSERKERALFPCCSGKTSGRRWWLAQCLQGELDLSLQGEQDFPLCARLGWWDDSGGMGQPGWMIFEGWREQINLP